MSAKHSKKDEEAPCVSFLELFLESFFSFHFIEIQLTYKFKVYSMTCPTNIAK